MIARLRAPRPPTRLLPVLCGLVAIAGFASAAEEEAKPGEVRVGAYVNSLSDLNSTQHTFAADFWLWFVHPRAVDLKPLKTVEPDNARDYRPSLETTEDYGPERYHAAKVRGVFNHVWDVRNFPFDRHRLTVVLSEAQLEADRVRYVADIANTAFNPALVVEGWAVEKVAISTGVHAYRSNFGVPGKGGGSRYATTTISIYIRREAGGLFLKLHAAVYIIFLVSLVTFLMDSSKDGFFSARVGLISGMILATVVNSHRVAATLGGNHSLTLPDNIHIVTLLALLFALLVSLAARRLHNRGLAARARLLDRIAAPICLTAYVAVNLLLVDLARRA